MTKNILNLEPKLLWKNFHILTQIPRPSKHEERIKNYLVDFAKKLNLEHFVDEVGNVIIRKPATSGMENRKVVVLQGHLDMVPQKDNNKVPDFDFEKDPIDAYIDGDWIKARGTTLGADNGIGIAAAMAILESKDIPHGPIEALFTIDEETGMTGAFGIKAGILNGDILMNLDSEDEGELYIGCAGGTNANISFRYKEQAVFGAKKGFKISISGLEGGHSGVDIHEGRGNSNKIGARILLWGKENCGLQLIAIDGGSLRNAIPRELSAHVIVPVGCEQKFVDGLKELAGKIKNELSTIDPDIKIEIVKIVEADVPKKMIDEGVFGKLLNAIYACPNGMVRMSNDMDGLVETSNNLAIVKSENGIINVMCLLRSSVDSAKEDLKTTLECVFKPAGAEITFDKEYPGWKANPQSSILKIMTILYRSMYHKEPKIKSIHAGLECGLLGGVYPHWDMISFGPTIRHPHSPDEKVEIDSVQKFWTFLVKALEHIPEKE